MEQVNTRNYVACDACKWVHFQVSRKFAEDQVAEFNRHFDALPPETQEKYSGRGNIDRYEICGRCGTSYKNMHDATSDEVPYGSTVGPVIDRNE